MSTAVPPGAFAQDIWDISLTITSNNVIDLNTTLVTAQSLGLTYQYSDISEGTPCPAGFFCDGDVYACPANTFRADTGAAALADCASCSAYETTNVSAATSCSICRAGSYLATSNSGSAAGDSQRRCVRCPPGSMSIDNSTACYLCGPGTYSEAAGKGTCRACPAGTYNSGVGATVCTSCPEGMYTYTTSVVNDIVEYTPRTGMRLESDCIVSPQVVGYGEVCLPGTYRMYASCYPCPRGYYCPMMSYLDSHVSIRMCPRGTYSPAMYAASQADCVSKLAPLLYEYETCAISVGSQTAEAMDAIAQLTVQAICAPRASDASIFLATTSHIYRLILQDLILQPIPTGPIAPNSIIAMAAEQAQQGQGEAHMLAVADWSTSSQRSSISITNLDTMEITQLGLGGYAGGLAIRSREVAGPGYAIQRLVYMSDTTSHCIRVFDIDAARQLSVVAGKENENGAASSESTPGSAARFHSPGGIAFLESDMASNRYLLIADTGNGVIRMLDTASHALTVSTWFAPQDRYDFEMKSPTSLYVSINTNRDLVVYVVDTGFTPYKLFALTKPTGDSLVLLTELGTSSITGFTHMFVPGPELVRTHNSLGALHIGVRDMIYVDTSGKVKTFLEDSLASTSLNDDGEYCVYPSHAVNATLESLCGNMYLDEGEECDTGNVDGTGCIPGNCTINTTGWACAGNAARCLRPCVAYQHVENNNTWHCPADCLDEPHQPGTYMSPQCQELDINECGNSMFKANNTCAASNSFCINTYGSYVCSCQPGYYGDGKTCYGSSYEIYTVITLPYLSSAIYLSNGLLRTLIEDGLMTAYGTVLAANLSYDPTFVLTPEFMTINYTKLDRDENSVSSVKFFISTFVKDLQTANHVVSTVNLTVLGNSLSEAMTNATQEDYVRVLQPLHVRQYSASMFGSPISMESWGLNVIDVQFNRSCVTRGIVPGPARGCWEVYMEYYGGEPDDGVGTANGQQSMNVFYMPQVARDPGNQYSYFVASTLASLQAEVLVAQGSFACQQATGAIQRSGTACCFREVVSRYHTNADFYNFVNGDYYSDIATPQICSANSFEFTTPNSDLVWRTGNIPDGGTNDFVLGGIDGLGRSEVTLEAVYDYRTRYYKVKLALSEDDLLAHAATSFIGQQEVQYSANFYVALANFRGTGGAALLAQTAIQPIAVSKTNFMTLTSYGSDQDPLISSSELTLHRTKISNGFSTPTYLYWLEAVFTVPPQYVGLGYGKSSVPLTAIMVGKSVHGADPNEWIPVCAGPNNMWDVSALQDTMNTAYNQPCSFVNTNARMCVTPQDQLPSVVDIGLPLTPGFITESDFTVEGQTSIVLKMVVSAKVKGSSVNENIHTALAMSVRLQPKQFVTECATEIYQARTLADIVNGSIYVGSATSKPDWASGVKQKVNSGDYNISNINNALEFNTTTVQGAFITFTADGADSYFLDPRASNFTVNIHDIHTVHFLEPIGGKGGPEPRFDQVMAWMRAGTAYSVGKNDQYSWLTPSQALTDLCPFTATAAYLQCMSRTDSTIKDGVLTVNPSVAVLRPNDNSSRAEIQLMIAKNLMQGRANAFTDQYGSDFYDTLSGVLKFNNRYRRAYVVNPVFEWSNAYMQMAQPGSTSYTVCLKIIATALVTLQTNTGVQFRRLLSTVLENDWSTPILQKQAHLAVHQPALLRASRHLLQASDGATGAVSQPQTTTASATTSIIDVDIPGHTGGSALCNAVLGVDPINCGFIGITSYIPVDKATSYCSKDLTNELGALLQSNTRNLIKPNSGGGVEEVVLVGYTLNGCPGSSASVGNRRLLATVYPGTVILEQTVMVSVVGRNVQLNVAAIQQAMQNVVLSTQFQELLGGGAIIEFINLRSNGTIANSTNTSWIVDIGLKNTTANKSGTRTIPGLGDLMFVDDIKTVISSKSSDATHTIARVSIFVTNVLALISIICALNIL